MTCHTEQHCFSPSSPCTPSGDTAPKGERLYLSVRWCVSCMMSEAKCSNSKWQGVSFCRFTRKTIYHFPTNACLSLKVSQTQALFSIWLNISAGWLFYSSAPGTYKSEENQLLLKVYQVKGPTQHYISKFKNDNWAMDGYVSDAAGAADCLFSSLILSLNACKGRIYLDCAERSLVSLFSLWHSQ